MAVRQTSCRYCGQDIENFSPYKRGEWRDRGNNTTCASPAGDAGQLHAPYVYGYKKPTYPQVDRRVFWKDPDGVASGFARVFAITGIGAILIKVENGGQLETTLDDLDLNVSQRKE